jgi:phosphoribosyl-ATP pyrophosphohydrolase
MNRDHPFIIGSIAKVANAAAEPFRNRVAYVSTLDGKMASLIFTDHKAPGTAKMSVDWLDLHEDQIHGGKPKMATSPYHVQIIEKGEYGQTSKIYEEIQELKDAEEQQNPILMLCEISDVLGAIEGYLHKHHGMTLEDALKMTALNKKAFTSGYRA